MQILTPTGYRDVSECVAGDEVCAFDVETGAPIVNSIVSMDVLSRPPWEPTPEFPPDERSHRRIFEKARQRKMGEDWREGRAFSWVLVNGRYRLFRNQSVWANGNVSHAKLLKIGDVIYSDTDEDIVVATLDLDAPGPDSWVRFTITGDHSFIADGLTIHNASRFWVAGTGNWSDNTNHWSGTDGGSPGATLPTSVDDASLTASSNTTAYTVTADVAPSCLNFAITANPSVSGVPTFAGAQSMGVFGNFTLLAGMTWSYTGTINFNSNATGKTITTAGLTLNSNMNFLTTGGGYTLQDNVANGSTKTLQITAGSLNTNAKTLSIGFLSSNSGTRTLNITNSTLNLTGTSNNGTYWSCSASSTLTLTTTGSTINFTGGTAGNSQQNLYFGDSALTYNVINITGPGTWFLSASMTGVTFATFTHTGTANVGDALLLQGNLTVTGTLTLAGNSVKNRLLIASSDGAKFPFIGTQRTISAATLVTSFSDWSDILAAGAASWNLAAITGNSGDALGNSGITFTTGATQTFAGGVKNWGDVTAWSGRIPLPQDDVTITAAGTLTADVPRLGRNINMGSFAGTFANPSLTAACLFGNLTFGASMTRSGGSPVWLCGRGSQTVTSNGFTTTTGGDLVIYAPGGTYSLADNFNETSGNLKLFYGTFTLNNFDMSIGAVNLGTGGSNGTRVFTLGSGTLSISQASSASIFDASSITGLTINAGTSTIKFTGNVTTNVTFAGGGFTYNNFWWSNAAATGTLIFTGSGNTFKDVKWNRTTARTITLPSGATTTIGSWTDESLATAILTVNSSTATSAATLSKPGGDVRTDYLSIRDSAATGGASWRAGTHSTSVSNNSGWVFGNVAYTNSGTLATTEVVSGTAAKNAKPSASLICATIEAGNISARNLRASATLASGESLAGTKTGTTTAAATLAAGERIAGSPVRSQSGAATLAASQRVSGAVSAHDRVAAAPLVAGDSIHGSFGAGTISASGDLGVGAELGGSQTSSYSEVGALDVGAEIAGRAIFQAETMTVEVLPSGATVEVLPSSATVAQRQRARS